MGSLHGSASVWPLEENFLCRQRAELVLGVGPRVDFKAFLKNSLFLAMLDIRCCMGAFSHCREGASLHCCLQGTGSRRTASVVAA